MRKPACCIYENKDADQLRSNCADDQRLCLRCTDSKSLYSPVYVGLGQKPRRPVFSQRGSFKVLIQSEDQSKYANQKFFELTRNTSTFLRGSMYIRPILYPFEVKIGLNLGKMFGRFLCYVL